jgi:hypothetical protein
MDPYSTHELIKMDNQSALVLIKNPTAGAQNRSKRIDVCYNFHAIGSSVEKSTLLF